MAHVSNSTIIDAVKEITVAAVSNSDIPVSAESGKAVADFMQVIYDKLSALAQNGA